MGTRNTHDTPRKLGGVTMLTLWLEPGVRQGVPFLLHCTGVLYQPLPRLSRGFFHFVDECWFTILTEQGNVPCIIKEMR